MSDERPLLETLVEMTASSVERAGLDAREMMMVRVAALAAVNAPPASYLLNLEAAADSGLTAEDARGVLTAVAPIIGSPLVVSAASGIATAFDIALALDDAIQSGELST
jgi:alkylhydroperoxidase/carboxymuconolactone decarboxylase family protein YurZ